MLLVARRRVARVQECVEIFELALERLEGEHVVLGIALGLHAQLFLLGSALPWLRPAWCCPFALTQVVAVARVLLVLVGLPELVEEGFADEIVESGWSWHRARRLPRAPEPIGVLDCEEGHFLNVLGGLERP